MATSTAAKTEQPGQIDLSALKTKQHGKKERRCFHEQT